MEYPPVTREQMISVVEGRGRAPRVPVVMHMWTHSRQFGPRESAVWDVLRRFPQDVQLMNLCMPGLFKGPPEDPSYRWAHIDDPRSGQEVAADAVVALADWTDLDAMLADWPSPHYPRLTADNPPPDGRYRLGGWSRFGFEAHWLIRGMENALIDPHVDPRQTHRLLRAITDFYLVVLERGRREMQLDGMMTTDDLGTQNGPFFSPATFDEFYAPYYRELIARAHQLGMHFWLHTCGNVELLLDRLVDLGIDVLHPIQKYAMDELRARQLLDGRLTVWAGFDVQRIIPFGSPDEVRAEVRRMIDAWQRPEGRFIMGAGNGINGDCPLASLEALYEEVYGYGMQPARGLFGKMPG